MMKQFLTAAFLSVFLFSCSNENKKENLQGDSNTGEICFEQKDGEDIIFIKLLISGDQVTGSMMKDKFETENNSGSIKGDYKDGIITAEFDFSSEDIHYVNQMQFKLSGDTLYQASGEMEEQNGKFVFKDLNHVKYENFLLRVACK